MQAHGGSRTEPPLAVTWTLDGRSAKRPCASGIGCGFCELTQPRRTTPNTWGFWEIYIYIYIYIYIERERERERERELMCQSCT